MANREIWIHVKTTEVTVDGHVFTVRTDFIKKYGMQKVLAHIRQHFGNEMNNKREERESKML